MNKKYNAEEFHSNDAFKRLEEKLGLERGQLSYKLGISSSYLYELKKKDTDIGIKKWMAWCDKLDCDIDFILGLQEHKRKANTDIHEVTGLSEGACAVLLDEMKNSKLQQVSPVISVQGKEVPEDATLISKDVEGVSSGVKTVDLFNAMSGYSTIGKAFKESMLQYITELSVNRYLEKTLDSVVSHYNENTDKGVTVQKAIENASDVFTSIRRITSLQGLTMTGRIQTGIADDFSNFCDGMRKEGYSESECRFFYDYIQSKGRLDALKLDCYDKMMLFLTEMSEDSQLTYFKRGYGSFDVSPSQIVSRPDEDYIRTIKELGDSLDKAQRSISDLYAENEKMKKELTELKSGDK